jgi:hypothetical protein
MSVEHQKDKMVLAVLCVGVHPLAAGERRELPGHTLAIRLMANHAVLGIDPLPNHLGIHRGRHLGSAARPAHRITLVDIAAETTAVVGQIKPADEE